MAMRTTPAPRLPVPCLPGLDEPRTVPRVGVKLWGSRADPWLPVIDPQAIS